ncbi:unannotated protein [freshwater metagenome]|uniref:Unannotated protein n=1 Tax=freshwater metagenome TaxID=449393 RepID=A0A6J6PJK3_9ZZZZ
MAGSCWFGASWTGTGLVATGLAAVACQVSPSARTCGSVAAGLLAGVFVLRAVGDAVGVLHWWSWMSPLGWNTKLRAWSGPRPWVGGLYLVLTTGLLALAQLMRSRRDLGSGLLAERSGPTSGRLSGPWSLVLRLHRTSLVVWTVGVGGFAGSFGVMAPGFDDLLGEGAGAELVDRLGGAFIAAVLPVLAMVITAFPLVVMGSAQRDEEAGRLGWVLSAATSRSRWLAATTTMAAVGSAWLLLAAGLALAGGYAAAGGDEAVQAVPAAIGWLPAVLVVASAAFAGLTYGLGWLGWSTLAGASVLALVGELAALPQWCVRLSPFATTSPFPAGDWRWSPLLAWAGVAAVITTLAWRRFLRRDLP